MIDYGKAGELKDKKWTLDLVQVGWYAFIFMFSINRKVDLLFSFPLGLAGSILVLKNALADEDDNMACFDEPKAFLT